MSLSFSEITAKQVWKKCFFVAIFFVWTFIFNIVDDIPIISSASQHMSQCAKSSSVQTITTNIRIIYFFKVQTVLCGLQQSVALAVWLEYLNIWLKGWVFVCYSFFSFTSNVHVSKIKDKKYFIRCLWHTCILESTVKINVLKCFKCRKFTFIYSLSVVDIKKIFKAYYPNNSLWRFPTLKSWIYEFIKTGQPWD